jgi:AcrR family transcriptional regulator
MYVKNKKRGRPLKAGGKLSADAIVKSAVGLLQQNGKVPSIRQVAGVLNVDPMAIYHYFSNKAALLESVTVDLMDSIYKPNGQEVWQGELLCLCDSYLQLLQGHAGLLETMLSMSDAGPAQIFISRFQAIISPLKLANSDMKDAIDLLVDYLHGVALAMRCNNGAPSLTVDVTRGPIKFYLDALELKSQQKG